MQIPLNLNRKKLIILAAALVALGVGLLGGAFYREYTLLVDGDMRTLRTLAFTPSQVLRAAGYQLDAADSIYPAPKRLLLSQSVIVYNPALPVEVSVGDETTLLLSSERRPANLLAIAGIALYPRDEIWWNGAEVDPQQPLPYGEPALLQVRPAKMLRVDVNGGEVTLYSNQRTVGEALLEAGLSVYPEDALSWPLNTVLEEDMRLSIRSAKKVSVQVGDQTVSGYSAGTTVGSVLADFDLRPQNLDYSIPAEAEPMPEDGQIRLVRVQEQIQLVKEETTFTNTVEEDPNAELDTVSVLVPGKVGLVVSRTRVKLEDGLQTASLSEGPWKASDPSNGVLGQGSRVQVRTETVNGDTLEYWRKVSVYATSYMPSSQGGHTGTASGIPLTKGIIAVSLDWYRGMKFQQVYVPGYGYGTIADTGGGIPGRYWIDLGFDDDTYESWHFWTTIYFLTPVPGYIPLVLP